jgi:hypothetical protein
MRTRTKNDAQKLTLTLSAPAREMLMREAIRRGISRTQVVEDLIDGFTRENPQAAAAGKVKPQPHKGAYLRGATTGGLKDQKKSNPKKVVRKAA